MHFLPLKQTDVVSKTLDKFKRCYGVEVRDGFILGQSTITDSVKCIGAFLDLDKLVEENASNDMVQLLRIPAISTFSIHTILEIVNQRSQYSTERQFQDTTGSIKRIFALCCENAVIIENLSETLILIMYFLILELLQQMGYALPEIVSEYLNNVLLTTEVGSFYTDLPAYATCANLEIMAQYGLADLYSVFQSLVDFSERNFEDQFEPQVVANIMASVISRCLEIPHELEPNSEDFQVQTTLVPILDYINHNNELVNAHFDVDRQTNDVLLLLDLDQCRGRKGLTEVFISYSPVQELVHFEKIYGFSPSLDPQMATYMNLCLDKTFLSQESSLDLFFKWFEIKPCVQFCILADTVYINDCIESFYELTIPFSADADSTYSSTNFRYDKKAFKVFAEHFARARGGDAKDFEEICDEQVEQNESNSCEGIDLPQLAWMYYYCVDGKSRCGRLDKGQIIRLSGYDLASAKKRLLAYLSRYFQWRQDFLQKKLPLISASMRRVAVHEQTLIAKLLCQVEQGESIFLSDAKVDSEKLQEYPIPSLLKDSYHHYSSSTISEGDSVQECFLSTDELSEIQYYSDFFSP
ncbi:LAME_0D02630g1_1 [Lachancea meyersii CBS 8951]|uniref:LAME_0D02630g1_1 n=1 Tax=Lachancea meyersii CBS 8951 TaxID=1266667 RepID=A0A1G4J7T5_9SACH|nr:LAME_0D02630g1_1 [Lachancea meyersii CBS 8951]